jgi:tyrosinase
MSNDLYTGTDPATPPPGFGGPETTFSHAGGTSGNLENNPHNLVHVYVGGYPQTGRPDAQTEGLMSDPGMAALDPIFYLHHANIDRMWAVWNADPNANPTEPNWLNGPASIGERKFVMPWPGGTAWVYTPQQMDSLAQLDYTYDDLAVPAAAPAAAVAAQRLTRLGAPAAAAQAQEGAAAMQGKNVELVGANQGALPIKGSGTRTKVRLDAGVRRKVSASLAGAAETARPDRVFLELENVRGTHDAAVLSVYITPPEGAKPSGHPGLLAGSIGLFGLHRATLKDDQHGGQGLDFVLDITNIIDSLHLVNALDVDSIEVTIAPHQPVPEQADITVGRVSIYRQGQ